MNEKNIGGREGEEEGGKKRARHRKKPQPVFGLLPPRQGEDGECRGSGVVLLEAPHAGAGCPLGFGLTIAEHVTLLSEAGAWPYLIVKFVL